MLEIKDFVKFYGKKEAVKSINITVHPGEIYGFLGHNGAGKTTTIKACAGLLKPTSGVIKLGGYDIQLQPLEAKKQLGYVPDNPFLYPKLTGREFLELVASVHGNIMDYQERMDELVNELDLGDVIDQLIGTYSHGTKRKITLCAALLHHPHVILLDEPTSGLDVKSARVAKDLFRKEANRGAAILFTTHILEIAEKICDRIGIIADGQLIMEGTMQEIRAQYQEQGLSLEDIFLDVTEENTNKSETL